MARLNYAAAIDRLRPDPELREQLRAKGLLGAKSFFWQESANKLLQVCREVIN
jgi:hypothetical protein